MTDAKKYSIVVFVLLTALAIIACAMVFPAAAVAEDTATGDYMVNSGSTLTLYSNTDSPTPLFEVPGTYYVTLSNATPTAGYYTVTYNGADYLVSTTDFSGKTTLHDTEKYGAVPAENKYFTLDSATVFPQGSFSTFTYSNGSMNSSDPVNASDITQVYGIFTVQNASYYRVHIYKISYGVTIDTDLYIAASSAAAPYSSYTAASITANPYEQVKAEIDKQLAENQNPPGDEEGSASTTDPENPDNNLERIILSVIIAILCVAVVLLIFRPGKKKKA